MKNNFVCIVLFWFTILGYTQTKISGHIIDSKENSIAYATIRVLNSSVITTSDQQGKFTLQKTNKNTIIEVSALGYATKIIKPDTDTITIVLQQSTEKLDEVIVSAQKREETLVNTAIAVTSIDSKKVKATRTWDLSGLTAIVPNYLYQELGVGFQQVQSIRGVQVFSENPAVATYIDDVNNLDILANGFVLTDIERIEVLRGPQGTLFGRNAMGGVVNITTKKPTNTTSGYAELGFGNLNLNRHSVGLKTPIIKNKLFFGFSGIFQDRDGYWRNDASLALVPNTSLDGETIGDERNLYGNLFLKWLATERLNTTLNIKAQRDWSNASGFFVSQPNDQIAFEQPDKIYLSRLASHKRNIINTSLVVKYNAPTLALTSISTYQNIGLSFENVDFSDGAFYHSFTESSFGEKLPNQEVWSQEIRVNSTNDSPLQYTAGAYGFTQVAYEPSTNIALQPSTDEVSTVFGLPPDTSTIFTNKGNNHGIAFFGEMSYKITNQFTITAGLRYDYEKRESTFNGFGDRLFSNGITTENQGPITLDGTYDALSPKLALSFAPTEHSNLYISYNRGFRAGGINAQRLPEGVNETFDPEYSNNYEIGYKINTLKNKLRIGAAIFYIDWTDLQFFNQIALGTFARENVGDATSMGIEIEASAIPIKRLQIDASFGLTNTEYKDFILNRDRVVSFDPVIIEENREDISGNDLSNTPSHTLFLGAQYTIPIHKKINATLRGEFRNIGKYYTDIQNTLEQPNYSLLNAKATFDFGKYSVAFWGQNLADEVYLSYGNADTSFGRNVRTGIPMTYGTSFSIKF